MCDCGDCEQCWVNYPQNYEPTPPEPDWGQIQLEDECKKSGHPYAYILDDGIRRCHCGKEYVDGIERAIERLKDV